MDLYDSSWKDFPDTVKITDAYMIFFKGGTIDHVTPVTQPVA